MRIQGSSFLIVGGASLAGSHIADKLLAGGARLVRCFDNFSLGSSAALQHLEGNERVEIVRGDMLRLGDLMAVGKDMDGVFLVAAFLAGPLIANMATGIEVNTRGVQNVLDTCRFSGIGRIVYSSSVGVYGNATSLPVIDESTPYIAEGVSPVMGIYSASKILGESLCRYYTRTHGIQHAALRYSSIYGPRQHSHSINALPVVEIYESLLAGKSPIIYGDGEEVHDYLYVEDLADANVMAMASDVPEAQVTVAAGRARSINDIASTLIDITGSRLQVEHRAADGRQKFTQSHTLNYAVRKAEETFGWKPQTSLEQGLRRYVEWRKAAQTQAAAR